MAQFAPMYSWESGQTPSGGGKSAGDDVCFPGFDPIRGNTFLGIGQGRFAGANLVMQFVLERVLFLLNKIAGFCSIVRNTLA